MSIDTNGMTYDDYIANLDNEEKQKIKEIFELFDKNLDGGIDIKELKFILNCKLIIKFVALDIYPNQDELTSMMYEADTTNKGFISKYPNINLRRKRFLVYYIKTESRLS